MHSAAIKHNTNILISREVSYQQLVVCGPKQKKKKTSLKACIFCCYSQKSEEWKKRMTEGMNIGTSYILLLQKQK